MASGDISLNDGQRQPVGRTWEKLPDPPTRVAFLLDPSPFTHLSGYTNRFCTAADYLLSANVEVVAAHAQHLPPALAADKEKTRHGEVPLISLRGGQRLWFWFGFRPYNHPTWQLHSMLARRVGRALDQLQPQVIHVATPGFAVFGAVFWSWFFDVPLVYSYHTHALKYLEQYMSFLPPVYKAAYFVGQQLLFWMMKPADIVLCPSPELVDHLVQDCGVEPKKVQVWKKGIDSEQFHPRFYDAKLRQTLLGEHGKHLLLLVARIAKEKNIEELKPWLAQLPGCVLAIVGDGPDLAFYKHIFANEIQAGNVIFTGVKRGDDLSRMFASADVFVMPSRSETLGFVVLEAMASGVPVVATRSGGIPSIIHDGIDSFLYDEGNVDDAACKTLRLLQDPTLRDRLSSAARKEAESMSWTTSHRHLHEVQYPEAIQRHSARSRRVGFVRRLLGAACGCSRRSKLQQSKRV